MYKCRGVYTMILPPQSPLLNWKSNDWTILNMQVHCGTCRRVGENGCGQDASTGAAKTVSASRDRLRRKDIHRIMKASRHWSFHGKAVGRSNAQCHVTISHLKSCWDTLGWRAVRRISHDQEFIVTKVPVSPPSHMAPSLSGRQ